MERTPRLKEQFLAPGGDRVQLAQLLSAGGAARAEIGRALELPRSPEELRDELESACREALDSLEGAAAVSEAFPQVFAWPGDEDLLEYQDEQAGSGVPRSPSEAFSPVLEFCSA